MMPMPHIICVFAALSNGISGQAVLFRTALVVTYACALVIIALAWVVDYLTISNLCPRMPRTVCLYTVHCTV